MFGLRLVATEVPVYKELAVAMAANKLVHARSAVIIAYFAGKETADYTAKKQKDKKMF